MARSLWKGKIVIKEFLTPSYKISKINYFKNLKIFKINDNKQYFDELKIYRRSHLLLNSQLPILKLLSPYLLYNGYDFIKRSTPSNVLIEETGVFLNLATTVATREMQVTHKVKLSKAARKNTTKLKKRTSMLTKSSVGSLVKKKVSLSKKIKK